MYTILKSSYPRPQVDFNVTMASTEDPTLDTTREECYKPWSAWPQNKRLKIGFNGVALPITVRQPPRYSDAGEPLPLPKDDTFDHRWFQWFQDSPETPTKYSKACVTIPAYPTREDAEAALQHAMSKWGAFWRDEWADTRWSVADLDRVDLVFSLISEMEIVSVNVSKKGFALSASFAECDDNVETRKKCWCGLRKYDPVLPLPAWEKANNLAPGDMVYCEYGERDIARGAPFMKKDGFIDINLEGCGEDTLVSNLAAGAASCPSCCASQLSYFLAYTGKKTFQIAG